jgi:hypothetical protein
MIEEHECVLKIEATEKSYNMHFEGTGEEILALLSTSIIEVINCLAEYNDKEKVSDVINLAVKNILRRERKA